MCHVHDTSKERPRVEDVRIANEFVDVVLDGTPGMPPRCEVEFSIDLCLELDLIQSLLTEWCLWK